MDQEQTFFVFSHSWNFLLHFPVKFFHSMPIKINEFLRVFKLAYNFTVYIIDYMNDTYTTRRYNTGSLSLLALLLRP
jgi:hypothetical protein